MDTINHALEPLKPTLRSITNHLPSAVDDLVLSILGPKCHASLLQRFDVSSANQECLSLAVSKALGIAIISAASVVKVPQLIKLVNSKSAAGLSLSSYILETAAYTVNLAYSFRNGFPFSTFGETAFIVIQDLAITVLILLYTGRSPGALAIFAGFATAAYMLFTSSVVDMQSLTYYQMGASFLGIASKVPQIYTIYKEGGTGQLSAFAVFNYLAGSLSRIFTTVQEIDDPIVLYGFIAGFILNAVLAAQMLYYWNSPVQKTKLKQDGPTQQEKQAIGASSGSDTSRPNVKNKTAVRRRA